MLFVSLSKIHKIIMGNFRKRRLKMNLTQVGFAEKTVFLHQL